MKFTCLVLESSVPSLSTTVPVSSSVILCWEQKGGARCTSLDTRSRYEGGAQLHQQEGDAVERAHPLARAASRGISLAREFPALHLALVARDLPRSALCSLLLVFFSLIIQSLVHYFKEFLNLD